MKKGAVIIAERSYSYSEMRAMQQDAIRRVNEMQRLAQQRVGSINQNQQNAEHSEADHPADQPSAAPPAQAVIPASREVKHPVLEPLRANSLEGFIKRLGLEGDQLLLLGLMLLLINEGADIILILAIFYMVL